MTNYTYLLLLLLAIGIFAGWIGISQLHHDEAKKSKP